MFYCRPNIEPLGLDLAGPLKGGGRCPAQFWGQTTDGRPVFVRYRGGRLTVHRGPHGASNEETAQNWEKLLERSFGPWLDGALLAEQACDLAGLLVQGERVPPPSAEELRDAMLRPSLDPGLDWSGRTTYWIREVQVTERGGNTFVGALKARFPDLRILEPWWDVSSGWRRWWRVRNTISECREWVTFGVGTDSDRVAALLEDQSISVDASKAFDYTISFRFNWARDYSSSRWLFRDQYPNIMCLGSRIGGTIGTEFKTGDSDGFAFVNKVIEAADECFSNEMERVDLVTGDSLGRTSSFSWYSRDLREWSRAEPGRYLAVENFDLGAAPTVGLRPT